MKNRKLGFTLVELIAVIVLLALVMMLVVPSLNRLLNENNDKRYKTYEDMMLEYTKAYPNYTSKSKICLNDLAMKEMGSNIICNGYVDVSNMKAYLSCVQNGKQIYVTSGYNLPSTCVTNSGSIPGGEAAENAHIHQLTLFLTSSLTFCSTFHHFVPLRLHFNITFYK